MQKEYNETLALQGPPSADPLDQPYNINRSGTKREKKTFPLGISIFVGLRAPDTVLQSSILQRGWGSQFIQALGGSVVPFATAYDPALAYFALGPYPAILSALVLGASTKNVAWILGISEQEMTVPAALMIGTFNTVFKALNTTFSL